jgi:DNA replication protein DnaC
MDDNLCQLLKNLKLPKMSEILDREIKIAQKSAPSYEQFLAKILREEYLWRQQRSIETRIQNARLPERWALETFPFNRQPTVKAAAIKSIASLDFIPEHKNLVFIGPTGVGKTGLASSILLKALEQGYRGLFVKAQDLFDDMYSSLADHSSRKLINRLAKLDVLLIDELGYLNLRPEQSNIFFKLMDQRYNRGSTIITTNLNYDQWYDFLGKKDMVSALLDRIRHVCQTINIDGPSLRTPQG